MSFDQKIRNFTCGLKTFSIKGCDFLIGKQAPVWDRETIKTYEKGVENAIFRFVRMFFIFEKLEKLDMANCNITAGILCHMKASILGGIPKEEKRDLINQKLPDKLKYWNLSKNPLTLEAQKFLTTILIHFKNLETLLIPDSKLTSAHISGLTDWIKKADNLKYLELSNNRFYCDGLKRLLTQINPETTKLEYLGVSNCHIGDTGLKVLAQHQLQGSSKLKGFIAKQNNITDHGLKILLEKLEESKSKNTLNYICLRKNKMHD